MKDLYDIPQIYADLLESYEQGDIDQQSFVDTIESLGASEEIQIIDLARALKNKEGENVSLENRIDEIKAEFKRKLAPFQDRKMCSDQNIAMLKNMIDEKLKKLGKEKLKTPDFEIKYEAKGKKPVKVTDIKLIPKKYLVEQEPKPNLNLAYKDLSENKTIPGMELGSNKKLVIK